MKYDDALSNLFIAIVDEAMRGLPPLPRNIDDYSEKELQSALEKKQKDKTAKEMKEKAVAEKMLSLLSPSVKIQKLDILSEHADDLAQAEVMMPNGKIARLTVIFK